MTVEDKIINRVASSPLVSLDFDDYFESYSTVTFDLGEFLFQGLILKEKDFRAEIKGIDWSAYKGKIVRLFCSADAIIPTWAYMLVVSRLVPYTDHIVQGTEKDLEKHLIDKSIKKIDFASFADQKVVVKGCGNIQLREYAYVELSKRLVPIVASLMYGEPCSTVPVYKRRNNPQ